MDSHRRGHSYDHNTVTGDGRAHFGDVYNTYTSAADGKITEEECRRTIFLTDPAIDRQNLIDRKGDRVTGTCEWILSDKTFQSWRKHDPGLLWICGGPGKGKTMMSIFLTQALERRYPDNVIYYFCNSGDDRHSTSTAILRALIWQITAKRPELTQLVLPYFDTPERTQAVLSSSGTLMEILVKLAQDTSIAPMYCLIDGLDECDDGSIHWLASHFVTLSQGGQSSRLHISVVSRDIPELRQVKHIILDPDNNDKVSTDINTFLSLKMIDLTRRHSFTADQGSLIHDQLLQKAEGTFLWIGYAMDELLTKATTMQVLEALEDLPAALPGLYSRMLHKITPDKLKTIIRILHWVTLAIRPLTLEELADAVKWHVPGNMSHEAAARDYINIGKPLISEQNGTVVLVHQSVKDYLLRSEPDDDFVVGNARIKEAYTHSAMAQSCLSILGGNSALRRYADAYWVQHAKQCGELAILLIGRNKHFFGPRSESRTEWWQEYLSNEDGAYSYSLLLLSGLKSSSNPPRLHMACFLGFRQWVELILASKRQSLQTWTRSLPYPRERYAIPLHYAALGQDWETIKCLLDRGADPNLEYKRFTSFKYTVRLENKRNIELMLDYGADVAILLLHSVLWGDLDLLNLAIERGASLDSSVPGRTGGTILHYAVENWWHPKHGATFRRLLQAGADPSLRARSGKTALQYVYYSTPEPSTGVSTWEKERNETLQAIFREFGYPTE